MSHDSAPQAAMADLVGRDRFADDLGVELLEMTDDTVVVAFDVAERHVGWHGLCHGGVLFSVADIVMSWIGNRFPDQALATHAAVDFVSPARLGERVIATGTEPVRAGRGGICDVTLCVDDRVVAVFRGNTKQTSRPTAKPPGQTQSK